MPEEGIFETPTMLFFYRTVVTNDDRLELDFAPWAKVEHDPNSGKDVQTFNKREWTDFMIRRFCTGWKMKAADSLRVVFDWQAFLALPSEGGLAAMMALEIWARVFKRDIENIDLLKKTSEKLSAGTSTASAAAPSPAQKPSSGS